MQLSTIDPMLPALGHCFDLPAIAQGFTTASPLSTPLDKSHAPANPAAWQVHRLQHMHYQPGGPCVATYELSQERAGQPPLTTIGVVDYTAAGFHYRLFQDDPLLPALPTALDEQVMGTRLATLAEQQARSNPCTVTPIRYRPGQRCALRYTLQQAHGTATFFGKLFRQVELQRISALSAFYELTTTTPALPRLPQPLAFWPDLQLLLLPVIKGDEFHELVFAETTAATERLVWFERLGAALAALHQVTTLDLPPRPLAADLAELAEYTPMIDQIMPALTPAYATILQTLTNVAHRLPAVQPVLCHGAMRTDQWLITNAPTAHGTGAQVTLIDLDTLCLANPAIDLSNCLAYLAWKALRQPRHATFIEDAETALLTGYARVQPLPSAAWLALYRAGALLKIAGRRFRTLSHREWALTPQLVQMARTIVETHFL